MMARFRYLKNVVTLELDAEKCTACGVCLEVCPHQVLARQGKTVAIVDRDACMECGACARNCRFAAITVRNGVGCAAAILNSILKGGEPVCGCSEDSPCC